MTTAAKADTWMPLYIGDYLADTMGLNTTQHGAYLLLLMHQWRNGPLADDDEELAAIAKCDLSTWRRAIAPKVRKFFTSTPEGLSQKRLAAERKAAGENTERRAIAGKAGAASRWGRNAGAMPPHGNRNGKRMATAEQSHDFANAPSPSPIEVAAKDVPVPLPEDKTRASAQRALCRSDPPQRWADLAEGWEFDDGMVKRPCCGGEYLDVLANRVLDAAGIDDPHWRGDFSPIVKWLKAGFPGDAIVAAVRDVAARPGYRPVQTLRYFDRPVREYRAN